MKAQSRLTNWLCLICVSVSGACFSSSILAHDPTTTVTFDFSNFSEISVTSVFNVTAVQGSDFSVAVTIDEDVADRVAVTQTGPTLNIRLLPGDSDIQTLEASVMLPVLNRVDLNGVINVTLRDFNQAQLIADVDGVSQLRGDSLMIGNFTARVAGVSRLDFVSISPIANANLDISGVSEATLNMDVGSTLTGSVAGTSRLFYHGTNVTADVTLGSNASLIELGETLTDGFQINAGLNGSWYNPDTAGQGFFVEVFPNIPLLFVAWFTYDTTQPISGSAAVVGDINHRWLTAQGAYEGNTATLDVVLTTGGLFDDPTAPANNSPPESYGTITISFEDCSNGQVVYDLSSAGRSGTIPITRIADDNVPLCEQLNGNGGNALSR